MTTMKKFTAILLVVLLALSLIACSKGSNSIVGTWELDSGVGEEAEQVVALMKAFGMTMSITFNADGTGTMDSTYGEEKQSEPFNYTYENGVLKVDEGDEEGVNIKIEGDKLYLESEGMQMIFKKK